MQSENPDRVPADREPDAPTTEERLTFPDLPRLELDQLLSQLVERASEVQATQGRLRGLLRANQAIIGDLELPVVLRRITEAARELVGARYAALGVLAADGSLAEFIHVGMAEELVENIGHLPQGKGLLGALTEDPQPIRLTSIGDDPRSSGFPPGHPPMSSFLGVPIRIREEVFGNLYFAESVRGQFSAEDEDLTTALAATAAVAVDNARHYENSRRQQEWTAATAEVTRRMLAAEPEDPLGLVARSSRELSDADLVTVVLPEAGGRALRVAVAVGGPAMAELAAGLVGRVFDVETSITGRVLTAGEPLRLADPRELADRSAALVNGDDLDIGPLLVVPMIAGEGVRGVLTVLRRAGRPAFSEADLAMAAGFANQASVALALGEARAERERVRMTSERERIAADLHDHVIQRLFGSGLMLHGLAGRVGPGVVSDRLLEVISDLDDTIGQIRTSIFALQRVGTPVENSLRATVLEVVNDGAKALGFTPGLRFSGPLDTMLAAGGEATVAGGLIDDLTAVLREALSNTARHARAGQVEVEVAVEESSAGATLTVLVADDGIGVAANGRQSGLANLRRRAERRGGSMTVGPRHPKGTRLTWVVPLSQGNG